jgi:hypothetical protein
MRSPGGRREHELRALVGAARWGAADPEVVEAIAAGVPGGDGAAWVQEWTAGGGAAWAAARREKAARAYLHAGSYYAAALALIDESDGLVEEERLWRRQRECWDRRLDRPPGTVRGWVPPPPLGPFRPPGGKPKFFVLSCASPSCGTTVTPP